MSTLQHSPFSSRCVVHRSCVLARFRFLSRVCHCSFIKHPQLFMYLQTLISLSFLLSNFFDKSRTAGQVGALLIMMMFLPSYALGGASAGLSRVCLFLYISRRCVGCAFLLLSSLLSFSRWYWYCLYFIANRFRTSFHCIRRSRCDGCVGLTFERCFCCLGDG